MKKNGVKNVVGSCKNGAKTETALSDIFVKIVSQQKRERGLI
ncbi:MAG: hypothetical protein U9O78_00050 [Patescibacteria group bacterium]|nr:hypothetical protein [Patescibacteria group bacterium]